MLFICRIMIDSDFLCICKSDLCGLLSRSQRSCCVKADEDLQKTIKTKEFRILQNQLKLFHMLITDHLK